MLAREAMEMLGSIPMEATVFRKKTVILRVCSRYDAREHDLRENVDVFVAFLGHYMRFRLVFQKRDTVIDEFVDRFHGFMKRIMPEGRDVPVALRLDVLLAVFSASYARVCDVHERLMAFLGNGISGLVEDAETENHVLQIIRVLRSNGFYHYPYPAAKNDRGRQ